MARLNNTWFEFSGIHSRDMGVQLKDAHVDFSGENRGHLEEVPGRSGFLWTDERARKYIEIKRTCRVRASKKRAVKAWLTGGGLLRFSGEPDAQYDAQIIHDIEFKLVCPGSDPIYQFDVTFTCQPEAYIYPPADDLIFTAPGTFTNPGTAHSLPRITITGSGSFTITIGMQAAFFSGVEGGIIIDSELGDTLTLDGAQLANDKMSGDLFRLQPGYNAISWIAGGEDDEGNAVSGSISQISITPRWRYI